MCSSLCLPTACLFMFWGFTFFFFSNLPLGAKGRFRSLIVALPGHLFIVFIPRHTKSGGVLCYSLRTLSVRPSVVRPSTYFLQTLHIHWYRGGVIWDCKWANFVLKQQSYGTWYMSKMLCASFPCSNFSTFLLIFFKLCIDIGIGMGLQVG